MKCSKRSTVGSTFLGELSSNTKSDSTAREGMIGWYHTGPKLRASDQEINDLFKKFIARPVMVIVDVRPQVVGMPTDAYFAVEEIKDVRDDGFLCDILSF
jgi:proteasome lid subunit RPN8/RPN11